MAKRATEDLIEAVAGPRDWFNDATRGPSFVSLSPYRLARLREKL